MTAIIAWLTGKVAGPIFAGMSALLIIVVLWQNGQANGWPIIGGGLKRDVADLRVQIADLKTADAKEKADAVEVALKDQRDRDKITHDADVKAAEDHQKIVKVTQTITKEIPVYVTPKVDADFPMPFGLVRILDAAALSASPDTLSLPSGATDDAASPVKASAVAEAGTSCIRGYAELSDQLIHLQDWIVAQSAGK